MSNSYHIKRGTFGAAGGWNNAYGEQKFVICRAQIFFLPYTLGGFMALSNLYPLPPATNAGGEFVCGSRVAGVGGGSLCFICVLPPLVVVGPWLAGGVCASGESPKVLHKYAVDEG